VAHPHSNPLSMKIVGSLIHHPRSASSFQVQFALLTEGYATDQHCS